MFPDGLVDLDYDSHGESRGCMLAAAFATRLGLTIISDAAAAKAASLPVSNDFASFWAEQRTGARTDRADLCETCARTAGRTDETCKQFATISTAGCLILSGCIGVKQVVASVERIVSYPAIHHCQSPASFILTNCRHPDND